MSHWYSTSGQLFDHTENRSKPGEFRDFTLADARKHSEPLFASVTTVIGDMVPKPGLVRWQVEQGIKACLSNPIMAEESMDDYVRRMFRASEEYRDRAADMGTAIHAAIADMLRGKTVTGASHGMQATFVAREVTTWMNENDYRCEMPEHTFVAPTLGFAGTADWLGWHNDKRTIVDFKTQEGSSSFYDEYAIQLAGYARGLGEVEADRVSLIADRSTGAINIRNWSAPTKSDSEPDYAWMRRWNMILALWFETKAYWPHTNGLRAL